ncbi:AMP-binding protein [Luteimonas sp. 22616]|uniref:AMP-binding protein n=1 Tax=Luteimonas sp. 22616 TaxID=3453951 RepID=UPI003F86908E
MSAVIETQPGPSATASTSRQPLACGDGARAIAFDAGGVVSLDTFFSHVRGLAQQLPEASHAINLCEDRYRFLVAFCAVALRGQTTLLPPSRTRAAIDDVRAQHPHSYCLGDGDHCGCPHASLAPLPHYVRMPDVLPRCDGERPHIDDDALVAIGFTSGSTGTPKPNPKTWRSFRTSTAQNLAALSGLWPDDAIVQSVATVPPQHMYGMEMSVLLPLLGNVAVHGVRPFFPQDVAEALAEASAPRLLVTTPVHLRALVEARVSLPPMAAIVTATAPLPQPLAAAAEARFGCEVREVFGSTETCVIARRRTALEEAWTPLPGVRVAPQPDGTLVHAAHLPQPVVLADLVELLDSGRDADGRFVLRGRQSDLLEIAGKRASLGDLTRRLLGIAGVQDGVVFQLDDADDIGVHRIAALVVAPTLVEADILRALRRSIDPVFLPRRLRCVDALPRNETGKLPRVALLRLLHGNNG